MCPIEVQTQKLEYYHNCRK